MTLHSEEGTLEDVFINIAGAGSDPMTRSAHPHRHALPKGPERCHPRHASPDRAVVPIGIGLFYNYTFDDSASMRSREVGLFGRRRSPPCPP